MKMIEDWHKESGVQKNKAELLDEMIDLYYVHLFSNEDVLASQVHLLCANLLKQINEQNAIFYNSILEEIKRSL